jgi:hypothetical protein
MMPQVVLQDDDLSRQDACYKKQHNTTEVWEWQWCHDIKDQVGNDAATETSLVSYCFHSSIIPKECGSGNDATIKINQDGGDTASRPMRRWIECHWRHYKDIRWHGSRNCSSMSSIKITQVGSDAASRPMRRRTESAVMPRVRSPWCRNQSRQWCRKKDLVCSHTAFIAALSHRSVEVASMPL